MQDTEKVIVQDTEKVIAQDTEKIKMQENGKVEIQEETKKNDSLEKETKAEKIAVEDDKLMSSLKSRPFSTGTRPVIRWIKGNGLDDEVTRAAIGHATRLFGEEVDYCLCTVDISPERARHILELAAQPVEWWPISPDDNKELAEKLTQANCPPEKFGYWWKWFPARVRPNAPEWILDGDMVIVRKPIWYEEWKKGTDVCRVSQDDRREPYKYNGKYWPLVDPKLRLYSGLISLPPNFNYMEGMLNLLNKTPLDAPHNGCKDEDEQGVTSVAFQRMGVTPIPLYEFPMAIAFENAIDFGLEGDKGTAWGIHFCKAFTMPNKFFYDFVQRGIIFYREQAPISEKFLWLNSTGQWGIPGWGTSKLDFLIPISYLYSGKNVLDIGTSRGRIAAIFASAGCKLTTIDKYDRGAKQNLQGLDVEVIVSTAQEYLKKSTKTFDLIFVDLHDNSIKVWTELWPLLTARLARGGKVIIHNFGLSKMKGWEDEIGVDWVVNNLSKEYSYSTHDCTAPSNILDYLVKNFPNEYNYLTNNVSLPGYAFIWRTKE